MGFNVSVIKLVFVASTVNLIIYCLIQTQVLNSRFQMSPVVLGNPMS